MTEDQESFAVSLALTLYGEGWDAHKAGEALSRGWPLSKRQGWQCRQSHAR